MSSIDRIGGSPDTKRPGHATDELVQRGRFRRLYPTPSPRKRSPPAHHACYNVTIITQNAYCSK